MSDSRISIMHLCVNAVRDAGPTSNSALLGLEVFLLKIPPLERINRHDGSSPADQSTKG
jgi:hypothetical protein